MCWASGVMAHCSQRKLKHLLLTNILQYSMFCEDKTCDCKNSWYWHPSSRQQLRPGAGEGGTCLVTLAWHGAHPVSHVTSHCTPGGTSDNFYDRVSKLICWGNSLTKVALVEELSKFPCSLPRSQPALYVSDKFPREYSPVYMCTVCSTCVQCTVPGGPEETH